jgi:folate-binding protein YgfZ
MEMSVATNAPAPAVQSPLESLLASSHPAGQAGVYRGVVTPRELDSPARETAALAAGAAVHDLGWLRRVSVRGEDRFRWLNGMVTNKVSDLEPGKGAWNLVLNAQGRIQGDVTVWRDRDSLEIEIAADQVDRLLAHFDRFIIMDDVELMPLDGATALGLTGPQVESVLAALGLPVLPEPMTQVRAAWSGFDLRLVRGYGAQSPHYELWLPVAGTAQLWQALCAAGATPVGTASLEAFRIAEGIPAYGIDIVERDLAQETSQMRALNFSKGCYLGQEIVERIRSRGNVHRHLRQLELTGPMPAAGTELAPSREQASEGSAKPAGHITSAAELPLPGGRRIFALGMIRAEAELGSQPLVYTAGTATGTARILAAPPSLINVWNESREP